MIKGWETVQTKGKPMKGRQGNIEMLKILLDGSAREKKGREGEIQEIGNITDVGKKNKAGKGRQGKANYSDGEDFT